MEKSNEAKATNKAIRHTVQMDYFYCPFCGTVNESAYEESFSDLEECWGCNKQIKLEEEK